VAWTWTKTLALLAGVVTLAALGWDEYVKLMRVQPLGIDFMPMWAAGHEIFRHPAHVYDFTKLTWFQHPLLEGFRGPRPFVYPPTSLLLFAPIALLPFGLANGLWTLFGLVAMLWVLAGPAPRPLLLAGMVLMPAGVLVLLTGQITFLIVAMSVGGLVSMDRRPALAGTLFALAGVLKPQAMVLLPVALIALGQWRVIVTTTLVAALAVTASLILFGAGVWIAWAQALGQFDDWVMRAYALEEWMVTPTALGMNLRLDPGSLDVWRLGFGLGAVAMVVAVFRNTDDLARRIAALLGGSLFITPYAMHYDGALVAPAAAIMLARRPGPGAWTAAFIASVVLCYASKAHWGAAAVTAFTLFAALTPARAFGGTWRVSEFAAGRLLPPRTRGNLRSPQLSSGRPS